MRNITLLGGTYNQDCRNQDYAIADFDTYEPGPFPYDGVVYNDHGPYVLDLFGVHHLRIDGVTIRNVSGAYRNFGFYICPWYMDHHSGRIADVLIENINLTAEEYDYDYRDRMLFCVAGIVENLTIQIVQHTTLIDKRTLLELGLPNFNVETFRQYIDLARRQKLMGITLKGVTILEDNFHPADTDKIVIYSNVDSLLLKDITILKNQEKRNGCLVKFKEEGSVNTLVAQQIFTVGLETLFSDNAKISHLLDNVIICE